MPLSNGCKCYVVFFGKNRSFTFESFISGWLGQISRKSRMWCFWCFILLFNVLRNSTKISVVIQACWLFLYLKALGTGFGMEVGCLLLPMTQIFSFLPSALQHNKTVKHSFKVYAFVPWGTSPSWIKDLLGTLLKKYRFHLHFKYLLMHSLHRVLVAEISIGCIHLNQH